MLQIAADTRRKRKSPAGTGLGGSLRDGAASYRRCSNELTNTLVQHNGFPIVHTWTGFPCAVRLPFDGSRYDPAVRCGVEHAGRQVCPGVVVAPNPHVWL